MTQSTTLGGNLGGSIAKADVDGAVDAYVKFHDTDGGDVEKRKGMYADMVRRGAISLRMGDSAGLVRARGGARGSEGGLPF